MGKGNCLLAAATMDEIRIWTGLGVANTIYEDDDDDEHPSTSLSVSPAHSPASNQINSRVQAWALATGHEPNVVIQVQNSTFCLLKDPLMIRSGYLRRQLKGVTQITLSPPLNLSAETFTWVAEFCYGARPVITPSNVAPLRIAAEILEMTVSDDALGDNLRQKTEDYFRRAASGNKERAAMVLRSCLSLLPEAESTASLVSRCIEALSLTGNDNSVMKCLREVKDFQAEDFELIVKALNQRMPGSHDILYAMIDHYLKYHNAKNSEETKSRMCSYIDCTALSPQFLMHAVQNPRMPLRLVVQAMFVEQLNTRRSIISAANHRVQKHQGENDHVTLGAILQRDAAIRQAAQLKAAMNATTSRIESIEKELSTMRELLLESSSISGNDLDSRRSASFRFSSGKNVGRGQVGSISFSGGLRFFSNKDRVGGTSPSGDSYTGESPRIDMKFGRRLAKGVKTACRLPNFLSKKKISEGDGSTLKPVKVADEDGDGDVLVIKKDIPFHKRSIL